MLKGAEAVFRREHISEPFIIDSASRVDELIDQLIAGHPSHNSTELHSLDRETLPSGKPDHTFFVGIDPDSQRGIVSFVSRDGNLVPAGSATASSKTYMMGGYPREFLTPPEIDIDLVRQVVKEFVLSGGGRPTCIAWQPENFG